MENGSYMVTTHVGIQHVTNQLGKMSGTIGLLGDLMAEQWVTQHFVWFFIIIRKGKLFRDKAVLH